MPQTTNTSNLPDLAISVEQPWADLAVLGLYPYITARGFISKGISTCVYVREGAFDKRESTYNFVCELLGDQGFLPNRMNDFFRYSESRTGGIVGSVLLSPVSRRKVIMTPQGKTNPLFKSKKSTVIKCENPMYLPKLLKTRGCTDLHGWVKH